MRMMKALASAAVALALARACAGRPGVQRTPSPSARHSPRPICGRVYIGIRGIFRSRRLSNRDRHSAVEREPDPAAHPRAP